MALKILSSCLCSRQASLTTPRYVAERSTVDNHLHEKTGALLALKDDDNAETARKCLINLLRANAGAVPRWLQQKNIDGLEALDYGEIHPMLAPLSTGRKRDLTLLRLQLRALSLVAYRRKLGQFKKDAVSDVAGVLGVGANTFLTCETRLRSEFGRLEVDRAIKFAENHASWVQDARKRRLRGEVVDDTDIHEKGYDDEALQALGKSYKAALLA